MPAGPRLLPVAAALLLGAAAAVPLPAQDPAWRLPPRGAAEYERTHRSGSATAKDRAAALAAEATAAPPADFLPHLLPAPWLCQGELTADQRAIADEPRDLRDVIRAVAADLRLRGAVKLRFRRLVPFGDLLVTGTAAAADANGEQRFEFAVATADPELRPGENKAALAKYIRPLCRTEATGVLRLSRTYDAARGVVSSFSGELRLVFADGQGHRQLLVADAWRLVAVHENQDAAFRAAVAKAIRDGAAWLHRDLRDLGRRHLQDQADQQRTYGSGRIALSLLTLLHAEVPKDDPVVSAGFAELARRELVDTYSLAVALLALAERHTPPGEADLLRSGQLGAPRPRVLPAADRALAEEWLARLRLNIDSRHDPAYRLAFNYVAGPRHDNSLQQYGLLGLYAAALCGLDVPVTTWRAAANHQLLVQGQDHGRTVPLDLVDYRALAAGEGAAASGRTRGAAAATPTRGFSYHDPERPAYGSMTAAGVGSLVITRLGLLQRGQAKADLMPKIDKGIQSGFAWLGAEFSVRCNPGYVDRADDNWYYYLYGLERTCELAGIALLQGRDWYYEGALQLLAQQQKNGTFRPERPQGTLLDPTCFAVLFLKKAALPAVTGG